MATLGSDYICGRPNRVNRFGRLAIMSFETDNQDKSNLVGDAKVMSDAVDVEQELIRLKDENRELKEKAKAWDNLEALVAGNTRYVEIGNNSLSIERFYVDDPYIRYEDVTDLKEAVSSAIESIRGES